MDFWVVYAAHQDVLNSSAAVTLRADPELAALLSAMTPEQLDAEQKASAARLASLMAGDWTDYIASIHRQAAAYAKLGISISGWSRVVRVGARVITPLVVRKYASEAGRLTRTLAAMQSFFDWVLATFGEAYVATKEADSRAVMQELMTAFTNVGDGIIVTDLAGTVTRMNPIAEKLTGWPVATARGRPLPVIFNVVDAQTRTALGNPVSAVLKTGAAVERQNRGALMNADGSLRDIADGAAPIRDDAGAMRGAVLVFRNY